MKKRTGSALVMSVCTFDPDRNLVVVMNSGVTQDLQENDGYVSLVNPDSTVHTTKWIGESRDGLVLNHPLGSVSRIRPGEEAESIAAGIPSAASMCYDSKQNQLVIPMNNHNALAFIALED